MSDKYIEWKDNYSVGIKSIDAQHKKLLDFTNALFDSIEEGTKNTNTVFRQTIKDSVNYVKTHFAYEEKLMYKHSYPEYKEHKKAHDEFIKKILDEVVKYEKGDNFVPTRFLHFLRDWYLEHIAVVDKNYANFFQDKGVD